MMPKIQYGKTEIQFSVQRSSVRTTVDIAADPQEGIIVTAPLNVSKDKISQAVLKKAPWILRKVSRLEQVIQKPPPREYVSGESYLYLGKSYRLKVVEDASVYASEARLVGGRFLVTVPPVDSERARQSSVRNALKSWYAIHAERKLEERVQYYSGKLGIAPNGVVIKNQMKRWGSCTKEGALNLNFRIIMAPMSIIDYVLVHELAHLETPDHSEEFWSRIRRVLPDYDKRKDWLRVHGFTFLI